MVIPRSSSNSLESLTGSITCSLARKVPLCCSMASTSVVLPWSTCAMMAILRILLKTQLHAEARYCAGSGSYSKFVSMTGEAEMPTRGGVTSLTVASVFPACDSLHAEMAELKEDEYPEGKIQNAEQDSAPAFAQL